MSGATLHRRPSIKRPIKRYPGLWLIAGVLAAGLSACADDSDTTLKSRIETPEAAARLGRAALLAGEYPAATGFYRRAIADGVNDFDTQLGLGQAMLGEGDLPDAMRQFRYILAEWPERPEANLGMGRVYLAQHKPGAAFVTLQAAERQGGRGPALYNDEGIALDQLRRHDEAQEVYRRGLAESPDDKMLRSNYGLSLAISGKYGEAIEILTDLAQQPDATARNRQNLALALGMAGDKEAARRVAEHDLSPEAVENNLRYYSAVRGSSGG